MNRLAKISTNLLHIVGIHPHDGKTILRIKDGVFYEGEVFGASFLSGHTNMEDLPRERYLRVVDEAAASLHSTPARVRRKLVNGEMIMYHPRGKESD